MLIFPCVSVVFFGIVFYTPSMALPISTPPKPINIQSLYGTIKIKDNFIKALISHPALKRLKGIDNAGPGRYFRSMPAYSLFDHALGVFVLLHRFQRPLVEQLAGLLEPIAHSVFAHQGTLYLRPQGSNLPYYLASQGGYLRKIGLDAWLEKINLTPEGIHPTNENFKALFQNPPFLSVIEIEMTLRLAFSYKLLSKEAIGNILTDLRFDKGHWFFVTEKSAEKLASLSLYFGDKYWGSHQNYVVNRWVAASIKRAIDLNLMSINDVRFGTDKAVLAELMHMKDRVIHGLMIQCRQPFRFYDVVKNGDYDEIYHPEFRGLNPLIKLNSGKFVRLTILDKKFKKYFVNLRQRFLNGIRIKFKKPTEKVNQIQDFNGGSFSGAQYKVNIDPTMADLDERMKNATAF